MVSEIDIEICSKKEEQYVDLFSLGLPSHTSPSSASGLHFQILEAGVDEILAVLMATL